MPGSKFLNWLLHHIRKFNKGKNKVGKEPGTLGGCMYYHVVSFIFSSQRTGARVI
jgi:hypothetical protein